LELEYAQAAALLHNEPIKLATVDCFAEKKLCEEHKIISYPAIRIFNHQQPSVSFRGVRRAEK
jgi:hypothetical protein